jgi:L-threonylcarbamoyladenylate synthase
VTPVEEAAAAIRAGGLAVFPTDTVYGLACTAYREEPVDRLSEVKGRSRDQPIAIVAASVDWMLECVPELRGRAALLARALLPAALTLVLPNPARRFPWLTGTRPNTIGIRVPVLEGPGQQLLELVGAVAATSANLHGGRDPARLEDVPEAIRREAAVVDGGVLAGTPSTVVDVTETTPRILREGAVPAAEVLSRIEAALAVRAAQ